MLGKKLKELRGKRTQEEVALNIGISRARYSHYENGRSEPDTEILQKLASFYGVSTDFLLGRTSDNAPKQDEDEFEKFANNPSLNRMFKEMKDSPEEDLEELRQIWNIIKNRKK